MGAPRTHDSTTQATDELEAVPIIHLPVNKGGGKASLEDYLKMIPEHLLHSEKKILPVGLKKIEHEDFIDYEIEFVEISEEDDSDDDLIAKNRKTDKNSNRKSFNSSKNENTERHLPRVNLHKFSDLVKSVREHQSRTAGDVKGRPRVKLKNIFSDKISQRQEKQNRGKEETNLIPVSFLQRGRLQFSKKGKQRQVSHSAIGETSRRREHGNSERKLQPHAQGTINKAPRQRKKGSIRKEEEGEDGEEEKLLSHAQGVFNKASRQRKKGAKRKMQLSERQDKRVRHHSKETVTQAVKKDNSFQKIRRKQLRKYSSSTPGAPKSFSSLSTTERSTEKSFFANSMYSTTEKYSVFTRPQDVKMMYSTVPSFLRQKFSRKKTTQRRVISSTYKPLYMSSENNWGSVTSSSLDVSTTINKPLKKIIHPLESQNQHKPAFEASTVKTRNESNTLKKSDVPTKSAVKIKSSESSKKKEDNGDSLLERPTPSFLLHTPKSPIFRNIFDKQTSKFSSEPARKKPVGIFLATTSSYSVKSVTISSLPMQKDSLNLSSVSIIMRNTPKPFVKLEKPLIVSKLANTPKPKEPKDIPITTTLQNESSNGSTESSAISNSENVSKFVDENLESGDELKSIKPERKISTTTTISSSSHSEPKLLIKDIIEDGEYESIEDFQLDNSPLISDSKARRKNVTDTKFPEETVEETQLKIPILPSDITKLLGGNYVKSLPLKIEAPKDKMEKKEKTEDEQVISDQSKDDFPRLTSKQAAMLGKVTQFKLAKENENDYTNISKMHGSNVTEQAEEKEGHLLNNKLSSYDELQEKDHHYSILNIDISTSISAITETTKLYHSTEKSAEFVTELPTKSTTVKEKLSDNIMAKSLKSIFNNLKDKFLNNSSVVFDIDMHLIGQDSTNAIPGGREKINYMIMQNGSDLIMINENLIKSTTIMPEQTTKEKLSTETTKGVFNIKPGSEQAIVTVTPQYVTEGVKFLQKYEDEFDEEMTTSIPLDLLHSGQYHEVNPGQYHEVNPGQYTEVNPGQYEEGNPGQYTELHPGQYDAQFQGNYENIPSENGQTYQVNDVKVDFNHESEHKIYTVEAKAGDFIIGEVGKIDINNGQTLEGVRYTAINGEIDSQRIEDIIKEFFKTQQRH